ncbi:MAG TPA: hypothetical protein VMW24_25540 [Sedimentisphaerales bacterium]|nr:hypothetical protein [Sedimentisphaerales bacterium]
MREFGFSETFIRAGNRNLAAAVLFFAFFAGALAWYICDFRIRIALIVMGRVSIVLGPILAIETVLLDRRLRKLKVLVHQDRIAKQCGKKQHTLLWKDIFGIKMVHSKSGVVAEITLYPKKPNRPMYLHGYRNMEDLAALIREGKGRTRGLNSATSATD